MTSERSKRRDFLSLIFIAKSISKKLLIKFSLVATVLSKRKISVKNRKGITAWKIGCVLSIAGLK